MLSLEQHDRIYRLLSFMRMVFANVLIEKINIQYNFDASNRMVVRH
jgi:hypothetical protein